jgi:hypothetical protein
MAGLCELHFFQQDNWLWAWNSLSSNPNAIWYYRNQYHRIYNPIKNSEDHDRRCFIKQWLPELAEISKFNSWALLNLIEQQFYNCEIGTDYPEPIVNNRRKYASDIVWVSGKDEVKEEGKRILKKHVSNPNRKQKKTKHNDYFFKSTMGKYYHGQLRNWSWNIASLFT